MLDKEKPQGNGEVELVVRMQDEAVRLDFTMSYYQLNCLLLDDFR